MFAFFARHFKPIFFLPAKSEAIQDYARPPRSRCPSLLVTGKGNGTEIVPDLAYPELFPAYKEKAGGALVIFDWYFGLLYFVAFPTMTGGGGD